LRGGALFLSLRCINKSGPPGPLAQVGVGGRLSFYASR